MRDAIRWTLALVLACTLILPACSPFGDDDDDDDAPTETPAMEETQPAEAEGTEPEETEPEGTAPDDATDVPEGTAEGTPEGTEEAPSGETAEATEGATAEDGTQEPAPSPDELIQQGAVIYAEICSACHGPEAAGNGPIPPLAGNEFVTQEDPTPAIQTVLTGRGGMPRFRDEFDDEQIAAVVSYIRSVGDNEASPVEPETVRQIAEDLSIPADTDPGGQQED